MRLVWSIFISLPTAFIHPKPCGPRVERALGFKEENFSLFYKKLIRNTFTAERIYNEDETKLLIVQSKIHHAIDWKRKRQIKALTFAERRSTIRMITTVSAIGHYVCQFIIFSRTNMSEILMKGIPPDPLVNLTHLFGCRPIF